ncbi:hypothetical protein [Microbispora bryophytorum]|uniref:Uncharacterized protein n=1 Tax=Microbispora bryophytorum subsp. camponoti TaxID=1677852 RepID=A0ABR8LF69_9ACTN|nr:hypothetical protein [Microbispora camponoti]MBD3147118.1 hypothetical protein [Microbispora camponoti]
MLTDDVAPAAYTARAYQPPALLARPVPSLVVFFHTTWVNEPVAWP